MLCKQRENVTFEEVSMTFTWALIWDHLRLIWGRLLLAFTKFMFGNYWHVNIYSFSLQIKPLPLFHGRDLLLNSKILKHLSLDIYHILLQHGHFSLSLLGLPNDFVTLVWFNKRKIILGNCYFIYKFSCLKYNE